MLSFQEFFTACAGVWTTERIYHFVLKGDVERSYTEYRVETLKSSQKQQIASFSLEKGIKVNPASIEDDQAQLCPGFTIGFNTISETGERVSMSLKALFVPDAYVVSAEGTGSAPLLPIAAHVPLSEESIQGYYLRDVGYSEVGAVAGRFTYQPTRQILEMTTFYGRSVAVDQMRIVAPDIRLRTILTYQRPPAEEVPTVIDLSGFGVERRQSLE